MENIETDYSGYKECGHPEYRKTADGPQPNDCGCVGDNYAEASAAHAAINTTDLVDPFAGMPNADDSENGEFSPAKTQPAGFDIVNRVGHAARLLDEARRAGLPMPGYVTTGAHDYGTFRSSHIKFQLASETEVREWAAFFGTSVVTSKKSVVTTLSTGPLHNDVEAYHMFPVPPQPPMSDTMSGSYVPGLAEHAQAAPKRCGACGRLAGMPTAPCGVCPDYAIRALSQHTQAACDTITKAARPDPDESCPRCGAVNWAVTPEGDDECVSCNYRPDTITKAAQ